MKGKKLRYLPRNLRRMRRYIHRLKEWPAFKWEDEKILLPLSALRHKQGRLLGKLEGLGARLREEATLETLTQDVILSSGIEGEKLPADEVRSSIARRLGIEISGEVAASRNVEGIVEMMLDATQNYTEELTEDRLVGWHATLFPTGRSGMLKIKAGRWRNDAHGSLRAVSGAIGKERVHYKAPEATRLDGEMNTFLQWFNDTTPLDPVLKAAIAHLWFVTLHPFDDGNGRIARAIADMQLARADGSRQRFYSMSAQIQRERNVYCEVIETTRKGSLDITKWLLWFFDCLDKAITLSEENLSDVIHKARFRDANQAVSLNERQRKMLNTLVDGFEGKLTSSKWATMTKCSPDTALRDIQDLIEKNILEKDAGGARSTSYKLRSF